MSLDSYHHFHKPATDGRPLMFLFHGTGGDETQFTELAASLMPEAALVSPRGDVDEHGAARFFRRTGEGVYDMDDLARATSKMAAFVEAHIAHAKPNRVLGLGYSNGANILASVIFAHPQLFDAAVLMHPLIPFTPRVDSRINTRLLLTAGRRDPICPAPMTERLHAQLQEAGAEGELLWHDGGHELRQVEIDAAAEFLHRVGNPATQHELTDSRRSRHD